MFDNNLFKNGIGLLLNSNLTHHNYLSNVIKQNNILVRVLIIHGDICTEKGRVAKNFRNNELLICKK